MQQISETQMQYKGVVPSCRAFASLVAGVIACSVASAGTARAKEPVEAASFAEFDRRAKVGEELTVVFFGASLTWGANATDQALTSYRARTKDLLEARYPKSRFRCYDAAIGGTGSQLGAFRLERDVLSRKPDLVFLDFSANDDNRNGSPLAFASYESLLRRIVRDGRAPVVAVMFPFKWEIGPGLESGTTAHLEGLSRRKEIAAAYGAPAADAAALIVEQVRKGQTTLDSIWDTDGVHPGDLGYRLFAEAAFAGFEKGVRDKAVCRIPEEPLHAGPFMSVRRAVLANLFPADASPAGWAVGKPQLVAACHDQVMSRWLDRLLIASNRRRVKNAEGKEEALPQNPATLRFEVRASYVMVFGEGTTTSGKYRVTIDGKPHFHTPHGAKEPTDLYDMTSARFNGNWNYHQAIVDDLDASSPHVLEIEPVLDRTVEQELRIESVCVAGGPAEIKPLPQPAAADTESRPFPGVRYVHRHIKEPREIDMHVVIVDLGRPGVRITTTGANGDRPGDCDLETTRDFTRRSRAQIGINSGFFSRTAVERRIGVADLSSLAVSDGEKVSDWGTWIRDGVNVGADNTVTFVTRSQDDTTGFMTTPPVDLYNALSGNARLIRDGDILPKPGGDATYPQAAIGQTADHHLILLVSDGRQPEFSAGMTYREVAEVLAGFGAVDAIALDGGGSATMVMADATGGAPRVLNRPSDGCERAVGNNLAVIIGPE